MVPEWQPTPSHERLRQHGHRGEPAQPPDRGRVAPAGRLLARGELPDRRPDLSARQSAAARTAQTRARQAAPAGPLGHQPRAQPALHAPQPGHRRPGPVRHLRHRPRPRRPGAGREHLAGGHLQRAVPPHPPRRDRHAAAVPPVLLPGRHPEPRGAGGAGFDPRGRRAGVRAEPRVRRRVRQPGPAGGLRDRRRRGGDRPAGRELAVERVPQPGPRRRGAADPAPQRLQDRQPDRAGPDPPRGSARHDARLRLPAVRGGGRRPGDSAPARSPPRWTGRSTRSARSSAAPAPASAWNARAGR